MAVLSDSKTLPAYSGRTPIALKFYLYNFLNFIFSLSLPCYF
ncbi:hypothetical protein D083_2400 [Dickeya solani RNS 08.23.3.1.A]|nr:hypothetical protein D083_2400 [Dickeya solani RNS 08.23.3.1.A]